LRRDKFVALEKQVALAAIFFNAHFGAVAHVLWPSRHALCGIATASPDS
jgi:hypothetical protein